MRWNEAGLTSPSLRLLSAHLYRSDVGPKRWYPLVQIHATPLLTCGFVLLRFVEIPLIHVRNVEVGGSIPLTSTAYESFLARGLFGNRCHRSVLVFHTRVNLELATLAVTTAKALIPKLTRMSTVETWVR